MYDPESTLRNLHKNYLFINGVESKKTMHHIERMRWLGGMEALLQCLNVIPSGIPFDLKLEKKKWFFIPYDSKESYQNYILRKSHEFLERNKTVTL
jgi:hypothetical protein